LQPPEISAVLLDTEMQDSAVSESILENVHSVQEPTIVDPEHASTAPLLESQNSPVPVLIEDLPTLPSSRTSTPRRTITTAARSPRQRRRRRELPMSQEAARRALVTSTQKHADATVRIAEALEKMTDVATSIENRIARIERYVPISINPLYMQ